MDLTSRKVRKTYWHLGETQRIPTRYDVVTSKLLYYPERGFAVQSAVTDWYTRYVRQSPVPFACYSAFFDPQKVTYRDYVRERREREIALQGAFEASASLQEDACLSKASRDATARVLSVLPFIFHGFQMQAAYCGQLAPEGKLVVAFAFKSADGLRRIQSVSRRLHVLAPDVDWVALGRAAWQEDTAWQPLREVVERLLVAYDFGEAWVVSQLVVEPVVERLCFEELPRLVRSSGDVLTARVLQSLGADALGHRPWQHTLVSLALSGSAEARTAIARWIEQWWPLTEKALSSALSAWDVPDAERERMFREGCEERRAQWAALGVGAT